ncbi:unnamed protein product [[Actinomadura] parvosata subsp. kistnae]|nr:unnamed protein product [Actinomadura parvosata subsp. kistnae]
MENPEDIQARVDWADVALPELVPPILREGDVVAMGQRLFRYGRNSTLDECL